MHGSARSSWEAGPEPQPLTPLCRYYEPLAAVAPSVDQVVAGPVMRKLLFMTSPEVVERTLKPHWAVALAGTAAEMMQAVPDMLEVVPSGERSCLVRAALEKA